MNRAQKMSWLTVICLVISGIVVVLMYIAGFSSALLIVTFGLCGVAGAMITSMFKKDPGLAQFDERDRVIELKAMRTSFVLSFLAFIIVCMGLWVYYHFQGIETISIDILTIVVWPPAMILFFSHAVTILLLYGKDNKQMEGGAA